LNRAVYATLAATFVSLLVVMGGFECSTLQAGGLPFACPIPDTSPPNDTPDARTTHAMAAFFWAGAAITTGAVGYGLGQFTPRHAGVLVMAGVIPHVLVGIIWIRSVLAGGTPDGQDGYIGYIGLAALHVAAVWLGTKAGQR